MYVIVFLNKLCTLTEPVQAKMMHVNHGDKGFKVLQFDYNYTMERFDAGAGGAINFKISLED